ncbi:hypothetical protein L218DRAFT_44464 [Marasmius fiardii PR-910]|nr:hypothetical protein L218DRAFT_44464 [Marasmius fiardii PR-910]
MPYSSYVSFLFTLSIPLIPALYHYFYVSQRFDFCLGSLFVHLFFSLHILHCIAIFAHLALFVLIFVCFGLFASHHLFLCSRRNWIHKHRNTKCTYKAKVPVVVVIQLTKKL